MRNPILESLNRSPSSAGSIKSLYNMVKGSGDPYMMLNNLAASNPALREVLGYVQKTGDPKAAFYKMAKEKNIDPELILSQLR